MSFSEFTLKDYELIEKDYSVLKEAATKRCANEKELGIVQKAFDFANAAHKNIRRRSGEPYMLHPIAVAQIVVSDIGLGYKSIAAALLHDVVEDTDYTVEDIRNLFGDKIASLVDGLTKIKTVLDNEDKNRGIYSQSLQAENFKRILLTLNDDVRVVLIKLADRLHNCRTIEFMPEHKRDKILSETMFIFIPLAHRLGLYGVKSEMENIWLRFKEPHAFAEISESVSKNVSLRDNAIDEFIAPIDKALKEAGIKFYIKKRIKTPYSIWRKMKTKDIPLEQIYDLYAVRIIFDPEDHTIEKERQQAYIIYSIVSGMYNDLPDRTRDWIKAPKSNGYEALHCTLMSHAGIWIEVQIRSHRMDDIAEKGIAAHWAYKREGYISENDSEMDKWLAKVQDILVSNDVNALELLDIIHKDLITSNIVVFTPKGEQKSIQKGSTALDFAYLIHTHIGNKAIAAKVNMKLVPLSKELRSGDQVEIITTDGGCPKVEWLQFIKTRHARSIVIDYFRRDQFESISQEGQKLFTERLSAMGLKPSNKIIRKFLEVSMLREADELYFRVGLGLLTQEMFRGVLNAFMSGVVPGSNYVVATCCNPIPGDPVVGFKWPDGSIVVHKKSCSLAEDFATKHGDWMIVPTWGMEPEEKDFTVTLSLRGIDRLGLVNELSYFISMIMGVNMRHISLRVDGGIFTGVIEMLVRDRSDLDKVITGMRKIDGIQVVERSEIETSTMNLP